MKSTLQTNRHTDSRRELLEWLPEYPVCTCKAVTAIDDCEVGNHYHKKKREIFCLVAGVGTIILDGEEFPLIVGESVLIRPGVMHAFRLAKGSILLGAGTHPYDPSDDYHA